MAIKNLVPRLAERGKIKIGIKGELKTSGQGKQFCQPKKLDHFLIATMERNQAGRLIEDESLMRRLAPDGGKIKEIPVRLLYDDPELNFPTRLACYVGNRCVCQGDGEVAQQLTQDGRYAEVECPCARNHPDYQGRDRCKINGTLSVLIDGTERVGGVWKFRTTSWNTANAILSSMALIRFITGGVLAQIPLKMVLSPKTVTAPGIGQNQVVYLVNLEYAGSEEDLANISYEIRRKQIVHKVRMDRLEEEARMILAHQVETPEEQAEVQQEFYPEGVMLEEEAVLEGPSEDSGSIFGLPSDPDQDAALVPPGYEGFGAPSAAEPQIKGLF
jgi:hypothetical protein